MENPSSNKKEKRYRKNVEESSVRGSFSLISKDLLHNILNRLPATSISSACCVSKTWNRVCNTILSKPRLSSALFQNPSLEVCVEEAVKKVLSEPIRPQFVIANIIGGLTQCHGFPMKTTLLRLAEKLGWNIPIVVSLSSGIMGSDAITSEFKEVFHSEETGISLTVGFFPGVKVKALSLDRTSMYGNEVVQDDEVFNFMSKVGDFSASVSGSISPMAIIMFGNCLEEQTMEKLDSVISKETVIVGDKIAKFVCRYGMEGRKIVMKTYKTAAVAFVFAKDKRSSSGIGEIQFSAALSSGVSSLGPLYKVSYATEKDWCGTSLSAIREGQTEILDGERILSDINDELEDHNYNRDARVYIGVTKQRTCLIGSNTSGVMTFLSFHVVTGCDRRLLSVLGSDIETGDYFHFYCPHRGTALSSCTNMSLKLRKFKLDCNSENSLDASGSAANYGKRECIGGFIFSCRGRKEPFLGLNNADSSIFLENFPGVPLAGVVCSGEIGRGISILDENEAQQEIRTNCFQHVCSSVYLLVSYTPVPQEH